MPRPYLVRPVLLAVAFTLTAAMSDRPAGTAAYQEGWQQGCWEGYTAANWKGYDYNIDQARLAADPEYRQGREDGLKSCYQEAADRPGRMDRGGG